MKAEKSASLFRMQALAAAIGMASGAVHAADPVVTNLNDAGEGSLRQALILADDDGGIPSVVTFQEGLSGTISLQSSLPALTDSIDIQANGITLRGASSSEGAVLRFGSEGGGSFAVRGLTVTGGVAGGIFAGIYGSESSLVLEDVIVTKNRGNPAVQVRGEGTLELQNSVISGNEYVVGEGGRYGEGAGIYARYADLELVDSKVIDNTAGGNGGGISSRYGDIIIERSVISGNTAGSRSGGIRSRSFDSTYLAITDSTISGNVANFAGGIDAYSYEGGTLRIRNSSITDNRATIDRYSEGGRVGGVSFTSGRYGGGSFLLENSVVEGNQAQTDAGLRITSESVEIISSLIADNKAVRSDGAFDISTDSLQISRSTITGNSAPNRAVGDIDSASYFGEAEFNIDESTISGHSSNEGAVLDIQVGYDGRLAVGNSTISGNTARDAVVMVSAYTSYTNGVEIFNSTFSGNRSTSAPVAIEISNTDLTIRHSTFVNNRGTRSDDFETSAQLGFHDTRESSVEANLVNSIFTSGNDAEMLVGGNRFSFYEGFASGDSVFVSISNVIMSGNVAVDEGSSTEGTPRVEDAQLAPLGYRGGFTLVHEPLPGSPAIDSGSESPRPGGRDQRGLSGNFNADADLGSVEVVTNTPPRMVVNLGKQIKGVLGTEIPSFSVTDLFVDDEEDGISVVSVVGLPTGLTYDEGSISGTLEAAGTFAVTAIVTDDNVNPLQAVEQFTITIPEKKSSSSGGGVPAGLLALLGFMALMRRRS